MCDIRAHSFLKLSVSRHAPLCIFYLSKLFLLVHNRNSARFLYLNITHSLHTHTQITPYIQVFGGGNKTCLKSHHPDME